MEAHDKVGRTVEWIGSSQKDIRELPLKVRRAFGYALYLAQKGGKHPDSKPLRQFGPGVLEIVEDYATDAYRAIYTVRFEEAVYVVHVLKKKSTHDISLPRKDIELIEERLKEAQARHVQKGKNNE